MRGLSAFRLQGIVILRGLLIPVYEKSFLLLSTINQIFV